jgi:hypothetical protein
VLAQYTELLKGGRVVFDCGEEGQLKKASERPNGGQLRVDHSTSAIARSILLADGMTLVGRNGDEEHPANDIRKLSFGMAGAVRCELGEAQFSVAIAMIRKDIGEWSSEELMSSPSPLPALNGVSIF